MLDQGDNMLDQGDNLSTTQVVRMRQTTLTSEEDGGPQGSEDERYPEFGGASGTILSECGTA